MIAVQYNPREMGDFEPIVPSHDPCEGDKHVIAATRHVMKALVLTKNMSNDLREILVDFDERLSAITKLTEHDAGGTSEPQDRFLGANEKVISWQSEPREFYEVEDQFIHVQKKIISWQSDQSMIWDSGPEEASEYLQAVDEVCRLADSLRSLLLNRNEKEKELLDRVHSVLQMAMTRLEEELLHILVQNKQFPEYLPLHSAEVNVTYSESFVSTEESLDDVNCCLASSGPVFEYYITDLVHPDAIPDIKSIASVMFASNYSQEFCQVFVNFWKDVLEEYLVILGIDILSIEDILKMDWNILSYKIKKWCRAIKIIFRYFLASEKRLFDKILGSYQSISSTCFLDATRVSMLCLLNFGEAVAITSNQPDRLLRTINMYEVLVDLLQDIDALFVEEAGCFIKTEFHKLLRRLADSIRATLIEFENHVASSISVIPFPNGGVHHLTKYVMNYIIALVDYSDTLTSLLQEAIYVENRPGTSLEVSCPMKCCLWSLTSMLEKNLHQKANLYRNCSLKHIFMMNNIHYMVKKVDESKLRTYFDYEWIRKNTGKYHHHATSYERATWSPVLSLLKDDGKTVKANLKERYRGFSIAFEEVYKNQTAWRVQDSQLREDLQIRTLQMVIPAYQAFTARTSKCIRDKYIRYSTDDLQNYIMDLFEGSQKTLNNFPMTLNSFWWRKNKDAYIVPAGLCNSFKM